MKIQNQIEIGDIVTVNFNVVQATLCLKAEVLSIPCATGDSWVFKEVSAHENKIFLHYVSEGCTVTKEINYSS